MTVAIIAIDIGHGNNTFPPSKGVYRNGKGYHEHDFNSRVAVELDKLLRHNGFSTIMYQKPFSNEIGLKQRTNYYNKKKVDLVWSIHANAGAKSADGRCAFYWHSANDAKKLAQLYIEEVKKAGYSTHGNGLHASKLNSWTDLHITRETNMTAVLTENGFMTNDKDFELIFGSKRDKYIKDIAKVHAKAICRYYGVSFKSPSDKPLELPKGAIGKAVVKESVLNVRDDHSLKSNIIGKVKLGDELTVYKIVDEFYLIGSGRWISNRGGKYADYKEAPKHLYRVRKSWKDAKSQKGAFTELDGAKEIADKHKDNGYKVFDENGKVVYNPKPTVWYRVRRSWGEADTQKGAFKDLDGAKECANNNAKEGYKVFDEKGKVVYTPKVDQPKEEWYRVRKSWKDVDSQIGAFHELELAKDRADEKAKDGYKVFDSDGKVVYTPRVEKKETKSQLYRVRISWGDASSQIGAFTELKGAKTKADENAKEGYKVFDENGKTVYTPKVEKDTKPKEEEPKEDVNPHKDHHEIKGNSKVIADKMVAFVKEKNPDAQDIQEIANAFIKVGAKYGIRGDIAFCQSIIETGWFRFDGGTAVTPNQHNYCGMGVTSKGMKGNSFDTVEDGVTAQIQHLFAYATKEQLPEGEFVIDPRFKYVSRGVAPHWEDLSNRWAMNANYGKHIIELYENLEAYEYEPYVEDVEEVVEDIITPVEDDLVEEDSFEQLGVWKRIIDYIFSKIAEMFGK